MNDPIKPKNPARNLHVAPILSIMALCVSVYVLIEHEHPSDTSTFEVDRVLSVSRQVCEPWGGIWSMNMTTKIVYCVNGLKVDVTASTPHYEYRDYVNALADMNASIKKVSAIQKSLMDDLSSSSSSSSSKSSSSSTSSESSEWPKNVPVPSNKIFH